MRRFALNSCFRGLLRCIGYFRSRLRALLPYKYPQYRPTFDYRRELKPAEIDLRIHRDAIGGMWEELGDFQAHLLKSEGLSPEHTLLDIGCGPLRAGVQIIPYLADGHYYGVDRNASFLAAGRAELQTYAPGTRVTLHCDESFAFETFERTFDYLLCFSVSTHLDAHAVQRLFNAAAKVMHKESLFLCTAFIVPEENKNHFYRHPDTETTSFPDKDPFHYTWGELEEFAREAGIQLGLITQFSHPRGQTLIRGRRLTSTEKVEVK